ncbi:MAG: hypothetical protein ACKV2V_08825 [Blastocatellia bacterium]
MTRYIASPGMLLGLVAVALCFVHEPDTSYAAAEVKVRRLKQNPLITVDTSASLGDDVNGPTVIRMPGWVRQPLGRYYMYFAHHKGEFIRLAYADAVAGPWKVYEPGVLPVRDTAFFRPQPDPPKSPPGFYTHVASPEIYADTTRKRLVMWFHGWWTDGQRWPPGASEAQDWARQHGYGQFTQVAESSDGIHFEVRPAITRESYLRVFQYGGYFYGMARLGRLLRSRDPLASFESGPNPFREGTYANRVRHVATVRRGHTLYVFFSGIGDAPERIMMSTMNLTGDWMSWKASAPLEVLRPQMAYECGDLPNAPSAIGDVKGRVRQLRDPGVFEENGKTFLFYSICGEQGIAAAELMLIANFVSARPVVDGRQ